MTKLLTKTYQLTAVCLILLLVTSCGSDDDSPIAPSNEIKISAGSGAADEAQAAFIEVKPNEIIVFDAGEFTFTNTLSMDGKQEVIIRGAGRDKTFLDFSSQTSGGEGVLVANSTKIRFEDLTIRDSKGDALKTRDCEYISFVNVGTVWSGEPSESNGAYGLYPVLCKYVYIDNCYAYGASDAGIYVGQSDQVIVKNSLAEGNVAGIEIENTTNADVYDNIATDNTGGILVFDLPGLSQTGLNTRVFNNNSYENNRTNFAPAGNIVGNVPAGVGIMVLSTKNVEIFENTLTNNNYATLLVMNYLALNPEPPAGFNPFPSGVNIHDNDITMTGTVNPDQPDSISDIGFLLGQYGLDQPEILTDGIFISQGDLCIQENPATTFVNMMLTDPTGGSLTTDISAHDCTPTSLPAISFDAY
ncbi:parallel beta-helix repeat-containing protein [Formosa agariphila KMM 3901]|uniref:Parallel beta-helix repeat-containing protein n=1 Tax=Formosa agariphila (strain DSM 15362 / KCTC 12365 / LMG 23005 / KMM 3901 / M-2Alg 35-1) TaxID=1347342 RepID=T2KGB3_FORAG|nr:parallel beta-helix domain-containing protein [Formosa agariphila]CDF77755.1 parallel beta-helix repeat-containing protein [Formosa agariphila KMM 3901]